MLLQQIKLLESKAADLEHLLQETRTRIAALAKLEQDCREDVDRTRALVGRLRAESPEAIALLREEFLALFDQADNDKTQPVVQCWTEEEPSGTPIEATVQHQTEELESPEPQPIEPDLDWQSPRYNPIAVAALEPEVVATVDEVDEEGEDEEEEEENIEEEEDDLTLGVDRDEEEEDLRTGDDFEDEELPQEPRPARRIQVADRVVFYPELYSAYFFFPDRESATSWVGRLGENYSLAEGQVEVQEEAKTGVEVRVEDLSLDGVQAILQKVPLDAPHAEPEIIGLSDKVRYTESAPGVVDKAFIGPFKTKRLAEAWASWLQQIASASQVHDRVEPGGEAWFEIVLGGTELKRVQALAKRCDFGKHPSKQAPKIDSDFQVWVNGKLLIVDTTEEKAYKSFCKAQSDKSVLCAEVRQGDKIVSAWTRPTETTKPTAGSFSIRINGALSGKADLPEDIAQRDFANACESAVEDESIKRVELRQGPDIVDTWARTATIKEPSDKVAVWVGKDLFGEFESEEEALAALETRALTDGMLTSAAIQVREQETKVWYRGTKTQPLAQAAIAQYANAFFLAKSLQRVEEIRREVISAGYDYEQLIVALPKQARDNLKKLENPVPEDKYQQQEIPLF